MDRSHGRSAKHPRVKSFDKPIVYYGNITQIFKPRIWKIQHWGFSIIGLCDLRDMLVDGTFHSESCHLSETSNSGTMIDDKTEFFGANNDKIGFLELTMTKLGFRSSQYPNWLFGANNDQIAFWS